MKNSSSLSIILLSLIFSVSAFSSDRPTFELRAKYVGFFHLFSSINILGGGDAGKIQLPTEFLWKANSNLSLGIRYDISNLYNFRPSIVESDINDKKYFETSATRYTSQAIGPIVEYEFPVFSWFSPYITAGYRYGYEKDNFTGNFRNAKNNECSVTMKSNTRNSTTRGLAGLAFYIADKVSIRIAYGLEHRRKVQGEVTFESSSAACAEYSRFDDYTAARNGTFRQVDVDLGWLF